jgi:hypothetical protein
MVYHGTEQVEAKSDRSSPAPMQYLVHTPPSRAYDEVHALADNEVADVLAGIDSCH